MIITFINFILLIQLFVRIITRILLVRYYSVLNLHTIKKKFNLTITC